eukprot:TRINITY_DN8955_c0_g1_i1.p1 TRINITY_DN8955_c0_g1~~TRINITY_DN8955_c0_g1_i1.p1  ORF type:complete len:324 (-),score=90.67 TRINITY_DN8955_c0_g1_i1:38-1009(-)
MPHNLYLQSALVIERLPVNASRPFIQTELAYALIDTTIALCGALLINASVLLIAAVRFHGAGVVVTTLQQAYHLLASADAVTIGGVPLASTLFGVALVASGQSSTLGGTLAGQYIMGGFLGLDGPPIIRRLATRCLALLPSIFVIGAAGDAGVYNLLLGCQVVLSLQLPFAVVPLLRAVSVPPDYGRRGLPAVARVGGLDRRGAHHWVERGVCGRGGGGGAHVRGGALGPPRGRWPRWRAGVCGSARLFGLGWPVRGDTDVHTRYARASSVDASAPTARSARTEEDDLGYGAAAAGGGVWSPGRGGRGGRRGRVGRPVGRRPS